MIKMIKAVESFKHVGNTEPMVFLAGSIEMGVAEQWQERAAKYLDDLLLKWKVDPKFDLILLNPRRDDWDSSWVQSKDNAQFREQVEWELEGMGVSDCTFFYFSPGTKSPITLLELGLHCGCDNLNVVVVCPEGFWRKGNVDVTCEFFGLPPVQETLEAGLEMMLEEILDTYEVEFTR